MQKDYKKAVTENLYQNVSSKLGEIEKNLATLDAIQLKIKDGKFSNRSIRGRNQYIFIIIIEVNNLAVSSSASNPITPNTTQLCEDNQTVGDQPSKVAEDDEQSILNGQPHVLQDTVFQLKDVYAELKTCLLKSGGAPNHLRALALESQVLFGFHLC